MAEYTAIAFRGQAPVEASERVQAVSRGKGVHRAKALGPAWLTSAAEEICQDLADALGLLLPDPVRP